MRNLSMRKFIKVFIYFNYLNQLLGSVKSSWSTPHNTEMRTLSGCTFLSQNIFDYMPCLSLHWFSTPHPALTKRDFLFISLHNNKEIYLISPNFTDWLWHLFFTSSILSFHKHQVKSLIWQAYFTRRSFNKFWMVIVC